MAIRVVSNGAWSHLGLQSALNMSHVCGMLRTLRGPGVNVNNTDFAPKNTAFPLAALNSDAVCRGTTIAQGAISP